MRHRLAAEEDSRTLIGREKVRTKSEKRLRERAAGNAVGLSCSPSLDMSMLGISELIGIRKVRLHCMKVVYTEQGALNINSR